MIITEKITQTSEEILANPVTLVDDGTEQSGLYRLIAI